MTKTQAAFARNEQLRRYKMCRKHTDPHGAFGKAHFPCADYFVQVVSDPRFNHALRRNAFANVPKIDWKDLPK